MVRVNPAAIVPFVERACQSIGASEAVAAVVATSLVEADRRGHASHGVFRLPQYVERAEAGRIDPEAAPTVSRLSETVAHVNGNDAFGQYVGRAAIEALVEGAVGGIGAVGVGDVSHLGRISEWAERTTAEDLLFVAFVSGSVASVAPPRSADRCFSTNPVAIGVPTFDALPFPIVVDIATSQVAHGKVRTRATDGESLPEGWAIGDDGAPLTDAAAFERGDGALLPLGGSIAGHKGFGLCIAAEIFAAICGIDSTIDDGSKTGNAATFCAIDPTVFLSVDEIEHRIRSVTDTVRTAGYLDVPHETGVLPGELEYLATLEADEEGIDIGDGVAAELRTLASQLGLQSMLPEPLADS